MVTSTTAQVSVDDDRAYGYLWWLKDLGHGGRAHASHFMAGAGGNRVAVLPGLDLVAVVTSENFGRDDAHDLTEQLIVEHLLPAVLGSAELTAWQDRSRCSTTPTAPNGPSTGTSPPGLG